MVDSADPSALLLRVALVDTYLVEKQAGGPNQPVAKKEDQHKCGRGDKLTCWRVDQSGARRRDLWVEAHPYGKLVHVEEERLDRREGQNDQTQVSLREQREQTSTQASKRRQPNIEVQAERQVLERAAVSPGVGKEHIKGGARLRELERGRVCSKAAAQQPAHVLGHMARGHAPQDLGRDVLVRHRAEELAWFR